jgi:cutinase
MAGKNLIQALSGALLTCGFLAAPAPMAAAQPCPDVEVVFARGTGEPPGVGGVGQAFVDSLRTQLGGRSLAVYPVNYPASADFGAGIEFARTIVDGIRDAGAHVHTTATACPDTRIVLGGFSQGAVVSGFVTADTIPPEVPAQFVSFIPQPLPPEVADHVAAVVLIGMPSERFMRDVGAPPVTVGPRYAGKTLQLCAAGDGICSGAPVGGPSIEHALYGVNGMTAQGATYAADRV